MTICDLINFNENGPLDQDEFAKWYLTGMKPKSNNFVLEQFINKLYTLFSQFKQLKQIYSTIDKNCDESEMPSIFSNHRNLPKLSSFNSTIIIPQRCPCLDTKEIRIDLEVSLSFR